MAPGRVVATRDDMRENTPPGAPPNVAFDDLAGNFVNQDLGGGRFALYAHLQPGSVRVKPGDVIRPGQVLGLVGNSGNSSEPHLHFHVMDAAGGPSNLVADGLPYVFDRFRLDSRVIGLDQYLRPARPGTSARGTHGPAPLDRRRDHVPAPRERGLRVQAGSGSVSPVTRSARNRARHWGAKAARERRGGGTRGGGRESGAWWLEKSFVVSFKWWRQVELCHSGWRRLRGQAGVWAVRSAHRAVGTPTVGVWS